MQNADGTYEQKTWKAWDSFNEHIIRIVDSMEIQGVPLVMDSTERRISRSQVSDEVNPADLRRRAFSRFAVYLDSELDQLDKYFLPFPEWLKLSQKVFLFTRDEAEEPSAFSERIDHRMDAFDEILELPSSHTPLTDRQKVLLRAQFKSLTILGLEVVEEILEAGSPTSLKHINHDAWYKICTTDLCNNLEEVIQFSFIFLLRDSNECTVESTISDINYVKGGKASRRCALTYANHHDQMVVKINGPDPLESSTLRRKALNRLFADKDSWNFIISRRLATFQSTVCRNKKKKAVNNNTYCFG